MRVTANLLAADPWIANDLGNLTMWYGPKARLTKACESWWEGEGEEVGGMKEGSKEAPNAPPRKGHGEWLPL